MEAKELRIGNKVLHELTIDDWEEITVGAGSIIQCEISPDSYCPIPLTEEWLLKFGFEMTVNDYYQKGGYKISEDMEFMFFDVGDWYLKIQYIHQLQNLYFALTGEEL